MPPAPYGYADISVELRLEFMARPAFITFGVDCSGIVNTPVAQLVSDAITEPDSLIAVIDTQVKVATVTARVGTQAGEPYIEVVNTNESGKSANKTLPANNAVLVHKQTTRGGRRGRGRLFIPWVVDGTSTSESGTISDYARNAIQDNIDRWYDYLVDADVPMVVLHSPGRTAPGLPDRVTGLAVSNLVATQRRRLGR